MKEWFTGDTHYGHRNLVYGESSWKDKEESCRGFYIVQEMNDRIVENINAVVMKDDVLYHVGEWAVSGIAGIIELCGRLNVKTIHLILGNHDRELRKNKGGIRGYFTSVDEYKEININGQKIVLCHYALRHWHHDYKGVWNLHGHAHGDLEDYYQRALGGAKLKRYKQMDVGIDTHPEFRPYSFEEIQGIMESRINRGHHNRHGNEV